MRTSVINRRILIINRCWLHINRRRLDVHRTWLNIDWSGLYVDRLRVCRLDIHRLRIHRIGVITQVDKHARHTNSHRKRDVVAGVCMTGKACGTEHQQSSATSEQPRVLGLAEIVCNFHTFVLFDKHGVQEPTSSLNVVRSKASTRLPVNSVAKRNPVRGHRPARGRNCKCAVSG